MNVYREFDSTAITSKLNRSTASLTDYEMINEKTAKVVIATTGQFSKDSFLQTVATMFDGLATPVRNSFKKITDHAVVGFVTSVREIRDYNESNDTLRYRAIASNILMDKDDESTWELREGASGKYLARQGVEDLSELANRAYTRKVGVPSLASIAVASVTPQEFVAYVDSTEGDMDYGFVVSRSDNELQVMASSSEELTTISYDQVVHAAHLDADELPTVKGKVLAAADDKAAMIDYYKQVYAFDPSYVQLIIEQIESMNYA